MTKNDMSQNIITRFDDSVLSEGKKINAEDDDMRIEHDDDDDGINAKDERR